MKQLHEDRVLERYQAGASIRDLAREFGVSTKPILRVLHKHGIKGRKARGPDKKPRLARSTARTVEGFDAQERAEVKRRFLSGETQASLAEAFRCGVTTIGHVLRAEGVPAGAHGQLREHHHQWKGGRTSNEDGYILVRVEANDEIARAMCPRARYILEHRLVMARHLGRPLLPEETVHHGPGGKQDNRIENLELWVSRHPRGQRVADLVAFAREIIDRYGDLDL